MEVSMRLFYCRENLNRCSVVFLCSCLLLNAVNALAPGKGKKGTAEKEAPRTVSGRAKTAGKVPAAKTKTALVRSGKDDHKKLSEQVTRNSKKEKPKQTADLVARSASDKSKGLQASRESRHSKSDKTLTAKKEQLKESGKDARRGTDKKPEKPETAAKLSARDSGAAGKIAENKNAGKKPANALQSRVVAGARPAATDKSARKQSVAGSSVKVADVKVAETETVRLGKFGKEKDDTAEKEIAVRTNPQSEAERLEAARKAEAELLKALTTVRESAVTWPDRIEVNEYDPDKVGTDYSGRMKPGNSFMQPSASYNVSSKRVSVSMEADRITEIQEALLAKGFYSGALTGEWDEATIDAMRRFQTSQRIDVTGYPTAHSLKKLGLTNW
jgi:hypothetical protein